jgi:predicted secreted protein
MTPNAATRVTALLGFSLALATPAWAGDRAMIELLGYSPDFRYFAFEEFGVQDGSGFPYSTIYLIDLPADEWVAGSPYRARIDDEMAKIDDARAEALDMADAKFTELKIGETAEWIAMNGDGEPGDATSLTFGSPGYFPNDPQGDYQLTLESFTVDGADDCSGMVENPQGFALTLEENGVGRELHRDASIPASRGCVTAYRIHGVVAQPANDAVHAGVAIISVYPFGFEGPDRRFIAVPLGN